MKELLAKMAGLLQDIYDDGEGGKFRPNIQEVLVRYNAAQQGEHTDPPAACEGCGALIGDGEIHDRTCPITAGGLRKSLGGLPEE